jgi:DNA-binding NarL/FixJ family response regulator
MGRQRARGALCRHGGYARRSAARAGNAADFAERITRQETSGGSAGTSFHLTTRESQILRLVWKGGSNKAIARDLFLTENTIETHLRRIYEKLGTRKRTQAAALAREAGAI